jgi:hypothetical protein
MSHQNIRDAQPIIDNIIARGSVPISVFQTVISLAQSPDTSTAFAHKDLIRSYMHILRTHSSTRARGQQAIYKLACLRVLTIGILASLLGRADVDGFLDSAVERYENGENGLTLLGRYVSYMHLEGLKQEGMTERTGSVAGITDNDVQWLVRFMYSQQGVLLAAAKDPTAWQGFVNLIYMLCYRVNKVIKYVLSAVGHAVG